jgi:hypothetical protein
MKIIDYRGEKCRHFSSCSFGENFSAPFAHKAGLHEKLCEKYGKYRPWIRILEE